MGMENCTVGGFYEGFGYCGTIFLLFIAALLWIVAGIKEKSITKVLWVTGVAISVLAVEEMIFFFPMAVAFCVVSAVLVFTSIFLINKAK